MIQYLYLIGALYLIVCPFTKVEESFNLQAMHDIIFHKWNLSEFDHFEFPGVVPRTFLGPLIITLLLSPVLTVIDALGLITTNKFICQYLVRATLGCCVLYSYHKLHKAVDNYFGNGVAFWFLAITASQYHFMFYLSRPLPNILALPLVFLAVTSWIKQDHLSLICFSAASVIIFRFELAIFLGIIILIEILSGNISLLRVIKIGITSSICALLTTVAVDSFFWKRLTWPEGEVFWFNVVENKSSEYGVSPFFWYWYSALPRALGTTILLVPFGNKRTKILLIPALLFVSVMSFLPHKELRFIIYTFHLFDISAATFCHKVWINRHKSLSCFIATIFIVMHLLANSIISCTLLRVASANYPGGQAIYQLHKIIPKESDVHVYIDNLSAQTGVSRFMQIYPNWIYNKTENLSNKIEDYYTFSHLLLEAKSKYSPNLKPFLNSHEVLGTIEAFSHISFNYKSFPPFKIKSKPMIFILKKNILPKVHLKFDSFKSSPIGTNNISEVNKKMSNSNIIDFSKTDSKPRNTKNYVDTLNDISDNVFKEYEPFENKEASFKMDVDDFFGDFREEPIDINQKKSSTNKVIKIPYLKEKKIKDL